MAAPANNSQIQVHDTGESQREALPNLVETYNGPSVHDMISGHTVAENIIKYNSQILDDENMELLKRFVNDPDSRDQILNDIKIERVDGVTGQYHGSLAGYIVLRHKNEVGETVEPVLTNDEIDTLKAWFRSGQDGSHGSHGHLSHHEHHSHHGHHEHVGHRSSQEDSVAEERRVS